MGIVYMFKVKHMFECFPEADSRPESEKYFI